jgi:hypothetical protein
MDTFNGTIKPYGNSLSNANGQEGWGGVVELGGKARYKILDLNL